MYDPASGRFLTKDSWQGDDTTPMSYNAWLYVEDNPVNRVDPSGMCYTDPNPLSSGYWSRFWDAPFLGPCSSSGGGQPNNPPSPTPSPSPMPTATCTPTVIPTPTPTLIPLGQWKITAYNIAQEADFPAKNPSNGTSDYVPVAGLQGTYRRQFIYSPAGVYGQGTGESESGQYITIDWTKNNQLYGSKWLDPNFNVADIYFTTGKGGANGVLNAWETVAINQHEPQLTFGDKVKIGSYNQIFDVEDTGTFPDTSHLDIFIGDSRQDAVKFGVQYLNVWKVIGG